jgi:(2Fe-2S) ferredoxin
MLLRLPRFERHIFVCINERAAGAERGCCAHKGGPAIRDRFKKLLAGRGLHRVVRANKAGCLDQCELGVTVVIYPEQVWYGGVTLDDVQEIIDRHIVGGQLVDRLLMPDQPHLLGLVLEPVARDGDPTD